MEIIPTVVPQTFDDVVAARERYRGFAPALHVDATDGIFAPKTTWLPMSGEKLPESASVLYEAHLMLKNPLSMGVAFARAGARRIIGHIEAFRTAESAREAFDMWQKAGAEEVGVAALLTTSLAELAPYAPLCDFVHLMTIEKIGEQGQPFDERAIARVRDVHARYPSLAISTDGGVSDESIRALAAAGAARFCVGAALAQADDPAAAYARMAAIEA